MTFNIKTSTTLDIKGLKNKLDIDKNTIITSTNIGEWMEQIMPSIYFKPNTFFDFDINTNIPGMLLSLISTEKSLIFCFEFFENPFIKYYNSANNRFIPFLEIERSYIRSYSQDGDENFTALKPKKSYEMMSKMKGAPVGGLITGALFKGAFKLAGSFEEETIVKSGMKFTLQYENENAIKSIEIICERFYIQEFDSFLKENWKSETPVAVTTETITEKKDGCFIATACYGNYEHPKVIILRRFRDTTLLKYSIGNKIVQIYYQVSPLLVKKINNRKWLLLCIRIMLITPIVKIISFLSKRPNN